MKKKLLFYVLIFVIGNSLNAQLLKKFSGAIALSEPWNQEGKVNYSYTEENGKKNLQGKYLLTVVGINEQKGLSQNVVGNFKNGLREGKWVFTINYADWKQPTGNNYKTGTSILTINYKSGIPDGSWILASTYKIRQKAEQPTKSGFTPFSKLTKENIKLNFNQSVLISFLYESLSENPKDAIRYTYSFDDAGFLQKTMKDIEGKKSEEMWYHGLAKASKEEMVDFDKFSQIAKMSKDSLAYLSYSYSTNIFGDFNAGTSDASSINISDQFSKIYNYHFLWNDITGDLNYNSSKSKTDLIKNATITGFLTRIRMLQNPKEKAIPSEKVVQFTKINDLIQSLKNNLTDSKIEKCAVISEANLKYNYCKKNLDTVLEIKQTVSNLEQYFKGTGNFKTIAAILENTTSLKQYTEKEIFDILFSKLSSIDNNVKPVIKDLEVFFKKYEFDAAMKEGASLTEQKNYDAAKKTYQRAQFLNPADPSPKAKLEELKVLESILDAESKRMTIFNYLVDNFRKIPANYKYGEERKNLYNAYVILKDNYLTSIDNPANDSFKKLEICNEAVKLVEKMNELQNKNTEDLEKQLKKIKDPIEIKKILGL